MPQFAYTARAMDGQDVTGLLTAASQKDAMALLSDRALYPLTIKDSDSASARQRMTLSLPRRVRPEQVANCLTQLSDLLQNGVPLPAECNPKGL